MVITNNYNKEISDEARTIYEGAHPHIEKGELTYRAAETTYDRFKKSYETREYGEDYKARKYTAIPGALGSFFVNIPVHFLQSVYHLGKSIVTGKKDLERSSSNFFKVFRDLEEGVGDLAILVNDKWGCYLVYDAQYNKRVYGETLYRKEHPEKMQEREDVTEQEAMGEFGTLPPDMIHEISLWAGPELLGVSKALRGQELQTAERLNVYDEGRFQELMQELTWAEDYLAEIGVSDKPVRVKLQALYGRLRDELDFCKTEYQRCPDSILQEIKAAREYAENLPKRPHPSRLFSLIKESDQWLEDFNDRVIENNIHHFNQRFVVPPNFVENRVTRLPKEFIKRHTDDLNRLYMHHCNLFFIPKEIAQLKNLMRVTFRGAFTTIPKELFQITGLEALLIRGHRLKALPKELGKLTSLRFLDIDPYFKQKDYPEKLIDLHNQGQLRILSTWDHVGGIGIGTYYGEGYNHHRIYP